MSDEVFKRYLKFIGLGILFIVSSVIIYLVFFNGINVVNPADNTIDQDPEAGKSYALVYNEGGLFNNIQNNDDNLKAIQEDLAVFARTTLSELTNEDVLLGFTFEKDFDQSENVYSHYGYFYGNKDRIEVKVTVLDRGVLTLSITNTANNTNIDDFLQLNGTVNELITKLPIEDDFYSIRYFNSQDEIVVGFYLGYSSGDIEEVEKILSENLAGEYKNANVVYSINSRGLSTLQDIKAFVNSPENK